MHKDGALEGGAKVPMPRVARHQAREPVVGDNQARQDAELAQRLQRGLGKGDEHGHLCARIACRVGFGEDAGVVQEEELHALDAPHMHAALFVRAAHMHTHVLAAISAHTARNGA